MVTHHIADFNGHRSCGSREITYSFFHITVQEYVIMGS